MHARRISPIFFPAVPTKSCAAMQVGTHDTVRVADNRPNTKWKNHENAAVGEFLKSAKASIQFLLKKLSPKAPSDILQQLQQMQQLQQRRGKLPTILKQMTLAEELQKEHYERLARHFLDSISRDDVPESVGLSFDHHGLPTWSDKELDILAEFYSIFMLSKQDLESSLEEREKTAIDKKLLKVWKDNVQAGTPVFSSVGVPPEKPDAEILFDGRKPLNPAHIMPVESLVREMTSWGENSKVRKK